MDGDPNDLLSTNQFIQSYVDINTNKQGYKKYAESKQSISSKLSKNSLASRDQKELASRDVPQDELDDNYYIINKASEESNSNQNVKHQIRQIKTTVSIDSRDRDITLYPKANYFKVFLGKTFFNVKKIALKSIEFPNTDAVISSKNNKVYWRNKEDIDNHIIDPVTNTYPVYNVSLRIGSYTSDNLQTELISKLNSVKRRNKTGNYHYFQVSLDINTDIVTFTSLITTALPNNPFSVTTGLGIVSVNAPNHGYITGDTVYLIGSKTTAGISNTTLDGQHVITVINSNTFVFEVNVIATDTTVGGGNVVLSAKEAPFQFMWGEYSNTVAQNIGYPLEDSSELIKTNIYSIANLYQIQITLDTAHNFQQTSDYIGHTVQLQNTGTIPSIDGNTLVITYIVNATSFLVSANSKITVETFNAGVMTFKGTNYNIVHVNNYITDTVLVTTFTPHNYTLNNIGTTLTFYNTVSVPDFNGSNQIFSVLSDTQIIIPGTVLTSYAATNVGDGGYWQEHNPLTVTTHAITDVIKSSSFTTFQCPGHTLQIGDRIQFYNIVTSPPLVGLQGYYTVSAIPDADHFVIMYPLVSFDQSSLSNAYIGTQLITMYFPYHSFNNVTSVTNYLSDYTIVSIVDSSIGFNYSVVVTLSTPHIFVVGDILQISSTDCVPNINGNQYRVTSVTSTTFSIRTNFQIITPGTSGFVNYYPHKLLVTTLLPHNLQIGSNITLSNTNSVPSIDGNYMVTSVVSNVQVLIQYNGTLITPVTFGNVGFNHSFFIYGSTSVGGIPKDAIVGQSFSVRNILDQHHFTFICNGYASTSETGGGDALALSSLFHGFSGVQTNTKNSLLNRSINLEGENYVFLCTPETEMSSNRGNIGMLNTGNVKNVFARIMLDQSPGSMVFVFQGSPLEYGIPLDTLSELRFSVVYHDSSYYDFNDLDFSFTIDITEEYTTTDNFNVNSKTVPKSISY